MTRLYRKARRNRVVAKGKTANIKRLSAKPVMKSVDVEAIKKEFAANAGGKQEAPAAEEKAAE